MAASRKHARVTTLWDSDDDDEESFKFNCSATGSEVETEFPTPGPAPPSPQIMEIPGFAPLAEYNEGYEMGEGEAERRLALSSAFLRSLDVDVELFDRELECWYSNNYAHAELRGEPPALYMRPTHACKHVLKSSLKSDGDASPVFWSGRLYYGYHGTPPRNIPSILRNGLRPSTGGALGAGLYFSPSPLYAQLYSSSGYHGGAHEWTHEGRTYFVDTLLLLRAPDLSQYSAGVDEIAATVGSEYNVHLLFTGAQTDPPIEEQIIARVPPEHMDKVIVQGIVVKLHERHPYDDPLGEWATVVKLSAAMAAIPTRITVKHVGPHFPGGHAFGGLPHEVELAAGETAACACTLR